MSVRIILCLAFASLGLLVCVAGVYSEPAGILDDTPGDWRDVVALYFSPQGKVIALSVGDGRIKIHEVAGLPITRSGLECAVCPALVFLAAAACVRSLVTSQPGALRVVLWRGQPRDGCHGSNGGM
jgi:hypothetical protein